jgi:hypothetical protein
MPAFYRYQAHGFVGKLMIPQGINGPIIDREEFAGRMQSGMAYTIIPVKGIPAEAQQGNNSGGH